MSELILSYKMFIRN